MHSASEITLTNDERTALERITAGRRTEVRLVTRARIVLLAANGKMSKDIAVELGINPNTVGRWRRRYAAKRLEGILKDLPRADRRRIKRNSIAEHLGLSVSRVQRVWKDANLKPHLSRTFKVSNDPQFAA